MSNETYQELNDDNLSKMIKCADLDSPDHLVRVCILRCPAATMGRYVYIVMKSADLKIYEIEIYGGAQEGSVIPSCQFAYMEARLFPLYTRSRKTYRPFCRASCCCD